MAATAAPTDIIDINGETLRWYSPDDDPNVAYGFCSTCGASMFFRSGVEDGSNEVTSICIGSMDDDVGVTTSEIWFTDEAASHIRLPDERSGITLHHGQGDSADSTDSRRPDVT